MKTQQSQRKTTGAVLRSIREGAGMSQGLLATKVGYSQTDFARIESGERRLSRGLSKQVAQAVANHLHKKVA